MSAEAAEPGVRREAAPVPFWRVDAMTFTDAPGPKEGERFKEFGIPLNEVDLTSPGCSLFATPRAVPLAAWSRLWPVLRAALQTSAPGRDPDVPALLCIWGRGQVVRRVPRVVRRVWTERASVWVDRSPRLVPFWSDQADVWRRLRAACGSGLDVRVLDARAQARAMGRRGDLLSGFRPDPETPVLVLGDLGVYGSPIERAAWLHTARRLRCAGVRVAALVPAPPARWDALVARGWAAVPWERGRLGVAGVARPDRGFWQARAERLLRLASPAAFVQPGLLRALRLLLPARDADAATEADVWRHTDVCAADATGLVLHAEAALAWRQKFANDDAGACLKARVRDAIKRWHEGLPRELLHVETLAWHALIPPEVAEPPGDRDAALAFAARLEVSSRRGVGDPRPTAAAVRRCARKMLLPMPAAAYQTVPGLKIVWAAAFRGVTGVRVPEGFDPGALDAELDSTGEPRGWAARQVGGDLVFSASAGAAWPSQERGPGSPVAWMLAAGPDLFVKRGGEAFETKLVLDDGVCVPLRSVEGLTPRSDRCAVTLGCWSREPWAVAAGRDRFGLWADAEIAGVVQRFRWIPPGRFRMGSPEGEAGRWDDEGPQRVVTWTAGRWLADTPVTQALWTAVMGKNPSRFQTADRPVDSVSWDDCKKFLDRINALVPERKLEARLPTEAEWEYACRAGTETATWLGDLEIRGENDAPLLDSIAWYGGNCGVDFELATFVDTSKWPKKQHDHSKGGTHPVRRRAPNPFGLYDMLGNVFEWCEDAMGPYDAAPVTNPPCADADAGSTRVLRGGSWLSYARYVRAAYRYARAPGLRLAALGFRLARGQEPGQDAEPGTRSGPDPRGAGRDGASWREQTTEGAMRLHFAPGYRHDNLGFRLARAQTWVGRPAPDPTCTAAGSVGAGEMQAGAGVEVAVAEAPSNPRRWPTFPFGAGL